MSLVDQHNLDYAKLFHNRDGGYSMEKLKRVMENFNKSKEQMFLHGVKDDESDPKNGHDHEVDPFKLESEEMWTDSGSSSSGSGSYGSEDEEVDDTLDGGDDGEDRRHSKKMEAEESSDDSEDEKTMVWDDEKAFEKKLERNPDLENELIQMMFDSDVDEDDLER